VAPAMVDSNIFCANASLVQFALHVPGRMDNPYTTNALAAVKMTAIAVNSIRSAGISFNPSWIEQSRALDDLLFPGMFL
jgi:hypothetical protein